MKKKENLQFIMAIVTFVLYFIFSVIQIVNIALEIAFYDYDWLFPDIMKIAIIGILLALCTLAFLFVLLKKNKALTNLPTILMTAIIITFCFFDRYIAQWSPVFYSFCIFFKTCLWVSLFILLFTFITTTKNSPDLNEQQESTRISREEAQKTLYELKKLWDSRIISEEEYREKSKQYIDII